MKLKNRKFYDEEQDVVVIPMTLENGFLAKVEEMMKAMEMSENKEEKVNE